MDGISAAAAGGLRARMEALDVLGNNLANAATDGYKRDSELYNLYFGRAMAVPGWSTSLPVIEGQWTDFSQGLLQPTGNDLHFALQGEGFFAVQGPSEALYTRNGNFRLSPEGILETREGYPVRLTGQDEPLKIESPAPLEVAKDGTVRQSGRVLGQLEVVQFDDPAVLVKRGNTYFRPNRAAVEPSAAIGSEVLQGKLEASNVSAAESAVRIVDVMRQFEMLQKAASVAAEMDRRVINDVARTR